LHVDTLNVSANNKFYLSEESSGLL
jgi:hypothetical protein